MLETLFGIFLFLLCVIALYLVVAFRSVKKPYNWVIEINRHKVMTPKIWKEGIHFLWFPVAPFMYVKNKVLMNDRPVKLTIGEIEGEGGETKVELTDCAVVVIAKVIYRVIDPIKATYAVEKFHESVVERIESLIRECLGGKKFDEANSGDTKKQIAETIRDHADLINLLTSWGIKLVDVSILDFVLTPEDEAKRRTKLAAEKDAENAAITAEGQKNAAILTAEGKKKATILEAEGQREAGILMAEAEKARQILLGEGEGERIKVIAREAGVPVEHAIAFIRSPEYFKALEGTTIYSFSEGGNLNFPAGMAAFLKAFSEGMGKGKRSTTT
jgi:regulator of protease activity HflC (stomatin/prohibitin superfamily)